MFNLSRYEKIVFWIEKPRVLFSKEWWIHLGIVTTIFVFGIWITEVLIFSL